MPKIHCEGNGVGNEKANAERFLVMSDLVVLVVGHTVDLDCS